MILINHVEIDIGQPVSSVRCLFSDVCSCMEGRRVLIFGGQVFLMLIHLSLHA